jgi:fumarylacetoacetate (FAA) hydrolase
MKLGSLKSGRDGRLIVVSRDLTRAVSAEAVAPNLQAALDRWAETAPKLEALARALEGGSANGSFLLDPAQLASPLPRAYQWCDGSAYLHHVELVRKARNGATARPTCITSSWCARRATPRCRRASTPIR